MKNILTSPNTPIKGFVSLPASKSISNRILIIKALCSEAFKVKNIANSDDTNILLYALDNVRNKEINIGAAGTSMRFLTAYLSMLPGERILTGSDRMKQRPIFELVNILRQIGADIEYSENNGYPPLKIIGKNLFTRDVSIKGNISSQFISALLLIAPYLEKGLKLTIEEPILSKDYIWMTIGLMRDYGIDVIWEGNVIYVKEGLYKAKDIIIEADWSAASYWFEIISLSKGSMIELTGLYRNSLQGDSVLVDIYKSLGVESVFTNFGLRIKNTFSTCSFFEYDFTNCPDLAQTLVPTLVAKNIPFKLTGLDNLSIKETDRIQALIIEFNKLGITIKSEFNNTLLWGGGEKICMLKDHCVDTYEDHRMALAFAPLSLITHNIAINNPMVVTKSYPNYWNSLREMGFGVKSKNPE